MKVKDLIGKVPIQVLVELNIDGVLSASADSDYFNECFKDEDTRGNLTVDNFIPVVFNHYTGNTYPKLIVNARTSQRRGISQ